MPQALTKEEQWDRLKTWLEESIHAVQDGRLERLPSSFVGERGEAAVDAYETCLEAMRFLEDWERFGMPRHGGSA